MVKEVVPLAEVKLAIFEVTLQNFDTPVGSGVLVFEHTIPSCQGNLNFVDPDILHIQRGAVLHMDWGVRRNLLAKLVVLNIVTEAGVGGDLAVDTLFVNAIFVWKRNSIFIFFKKVQSGFFFTKHLERLGNVVK